MTNLTKQLAAACGYENVTPEVRRFQSGASNGLVLDAKDEIERLREALREVADAQSFGDVLDIACNALKPQGRALEQNAGEREYDPNVAPCDDAEFGAKP